MSAQHQNKYREIVPISSGFFLPLEVISELGLSKKGPPEAQLRIFSVSLKDLKYLSIIFYNHRFIVKYITKMLPKLVMNFQYYTLLTLFVFDPKDI